MIRTITYFIFVTIFLNGCFSKENIEVIKQNRIELGNVKLNYYSDKSVSSLEVPPDLTSPSYENSFRLSDLVKDVDNNYVNLTDKEIKDKKERILNIGNDITVKKSGNRRWLVIDKSSELVWNLSKQFLKEHGFVIKKSNKKTGIMETDYLENKEEPPEQALGTIRSMFAKTIENVSYTLKSVDKYMIRVEPLSDDKTEVHLSLYSLSEVITGGGSSNETTLWQKQDKDFSLEAEMLYSLMLYLGSDSANAREKILNAKDDNKIIVSVSDGLNGYAKLTFNLNISETWDNMAWAISESSLELDDKDIKERAFYVNLARTADVGIMSSIFGKEAILKPYQILLKEIDTDKTEVYFNDISEENEIETKQFSYEFFKEIEKLFIK